LIKLILGGFPCTQFSIAQKNKRINKVDFTADEFINWKSTTPEWWLHIDEFEKLVGDSLGIDNYKFDLGLQLFFNCIVAVDRSITNGDTVYYLFENVASMQKQIKEVMNEILFKLYGGQMTEINSALVSAQNRKRIYFTNFGEIDQPEDREILLRDILESGEGWQDKTFAYTTRCQGAIPEDTLTKHRPIIFQKSHGFNKDGVKYDKAPILTANGDYQDNNHVVEPIRIGDLPNEKGNINGCQSGRIYSVNGKSVNLCSGAGGRGAQTGLYTTPIATEQLSEQYYHGNEDTQVFGKIECKNTSDNNGQPAQGTRVYNTNYKSICLDADSRKYIIDEYNPCFVDKSGQNIQIYEVKNGLISIKDKKYPIKLSDGYYIVRKLTVNECRRLQTIPDWYIMPCSASQNYKMLGNGWTVEVIKHILSYIPGITSEPIEVLSMYDGMSCGQIALKELGANVIRYYATEIDKYTIKTTQTNFPDTIQLDNAFQVREPDWSLDKKRFTA
jgi:DNA (cytosine-5)-methyltransferase 3A